MSAMLIETAAWNHFDPVNHPVDHPVDQPRGDADSFLIQIGSDTVGARVSSAESIRNVCIALERSICGREGGQSGDAQAQAAPASPAPVEYVLFAFHPVV